MNELRRKIGIVFQAYNLFPHMTVLQNVTLAPRKTRRSSRDEAEAKARLLLRRIGLEDKANEYPGPALRRPAAARRDRARARDGAEADAARRDHERARPAARHRRARPRPRARGERHDDDHRDARDGLRARGGRQGLLPRQGPDPRGGPTRSRSSPTRTSRAPASSSRACSRRRSRRERSREAGEAEPRAARDRGVHRHPAVLRLVDGVDARTREAARRPVDERRQAADDVARPVSVDGGEDLALGARPAARADRRRLDRGAAAVRVLRRPASRRS